MKCCRAHTRACSVTEPDKCCVRSQLQEGEPFARRTRGLRMTGCCIPFRTSRCRMQSCDLVRVYMRGHQDRMKTRTNFSMHVGLHAVLTQTRVAHLHPLQSPVMLDAIALIGTASRPLLHPHRLCCRPHIERTLEGSPKSYPHRTSCISARHQLRSCLCPLCTSSQPRRASALMEPLWNFP